MPNTLILCDCSGSQKLDAKVLSKACGMDCSRVHTALCTRELGDAAALIKEGGAMVACLQERQVFEELADELGVEPPLFVDLRDRAGWSDEGEKTTAKMAALLAAATLEAPAIKMFDLQSEGQCLIVGDAPVALAAAAQLCEALNVTVLLENAEDIPLQRDFDVVIGELRQASGSLGQFKVTIDGLQLIEPGGRGAARLSSPRDGGHSDCDLILDLRGGSALFHHKRDGYLRADPRHPDGVSKAVIEASQLVGGFEKPFYVALDPHICAHSRAGITGCSNCIDTCETGAILADGDHVSIDPLICAGCGGCATVCPSGAIAHAAPDFGYLLKRLVSMADAYREAGGKAPRLLVHDTDFGTEMISLSARFGRGLPADVIPLEVESLAGFGHAEMLAALGCGFAAVDILLTPKTERPLLENALELALAISNNAAIRLLDLADPEALSDALYGQQVAKPAAPILPIGNRRQVTRLAAKALHGSTADTPVPLPGGAPYGAVVVDPDKCTLCLSCVSLCPSGALLDNEDSPQLRFQEDACLQCGICIGACPETAIQLKPQLDLSDAALSQRVLHEEEPFGCISCGALFGVKSSVERVMEKLAGIHPMFTGSDNAKLIQMCDKCRIEAQYHSSSSPFQSAPRPLPRTTDDYLKRRDN
ncbi:MAG: 4Fe-4S binding protein [Rhodobacteraceae bacterium]|nr:4Fe-4S binding protein [Paracoccaceae bacterium]